MGAGGRRRWRWWGGEGLPGEQAQRIVLVSYGESMARTFQKVLQFIFLWEEERRRQATAAATRAPDCILGLPGHRFHWLPPLQPPPKVLRQVESQETKLLENPQRRVLHS